MKKVNRKIIIIFLLLIILTLQIGPAVMAIENNTQDDYKTLEQYLIENGVDIDGDKKISDEEWAKVKNLEDLDETINDFTGIEKAINLQYLERIDSAYIYQIDFTKLTKLKKLEIDNKYNQKENKVKLPAMPELEEITFYGIDDLDISKLENLNTLCIYRCGYIKLPKFKNIEYINISKAKVNETIDLQDCENVHGYINEEIDKEKIKLNKNTMLTKRDGSYNLEKLEDEINIELNKEYQLGVGETTYKLVKNENDNVATFNNSVTSVKIKASHIGTTNMTVKDILGKEKTIKINVYKPEVKTYDTKLENTGITAKFLNDGIVLKSNGELWGASRIDTNVKDYKEIYSWKNFLKHNEEMELDFFEVYEDADINFYNTSEVYSIYGFPTDTVHSKFILKNNNLLKIRSEIVHHNNIAGKNNDNYIINTISNVQAIGNNSYLTTDGKFYKVNINYITEELERNLIKENVKKLINDCIVLNDDTTWYIYKENGKYECNKLADFAIKDMGYYATATGKTEYDDPYNEDLYLYKAAVIDNQDNLWCCNNTDSYDGKIDFDNNGVKLLKRSSEWHKRREYKYKQNNYMKVLENGDLVLKKNNKKILDNVLEVTRYGDFIRTDGTIWSYSEEYGLTKITESTPSEDEDEDKNFLNPTAQIHEKELGNKSILYGISNATKVEDFKKQNNFNNAYEVKICDKNEKEISDKDLIGTGSKVKLYKQGKLVKEYLVILYGDTTGDGKITSVDALAIIKHINNKIPFTKEEYIEAGKVRKESGQKLTSVDALATIKSINGKFIIIKNT